MEEGFWAKTGVLLSVVAIIVGVLLWYSGLLTTKYEWRITRQSTGQVHIWDAKCKIAESTSEEIKCDESRVNQKIYLCKDGAVMVTGEPLQGTSVDIDLDKSKVRIKGKGGGCGEDVQLWKTVDVCECVKIRAIPFLNY